MDKSFEIKGYINNVLKETGLEGADAFDKALLLNALGKLEAAEHSDEYKDVITGELEKLVENDNISIGENDLVNYMYGNACYSVGKNDIAVNIAKQTETQPRTESGYFTGAEGGRCLCTAFKALSFYMNYETKDGGKEHYNDIIAQYNAIYAECFKNAGVNGSKRWLNLGPLSFQPSEFAKVAVILFLAWQIERTKKATMGFGFMCRTILTLLPIIGLVGSNNLSTAIIILGIGGILIFVSNPGYLEFIGLGSAGAGFIAVFLAAESYRLERLAIWRNPEKYEKGFQTIQGLYAIGSGGIFGRGFGNSLQKLGFVPEAQNDMIFSIICEEMGAAGAIFLIFLFAMLLWRLGVAAMHAKDLAGALICCGIMGHLALQVILNIAVVTNTIPNTGITLPFISYGGTSAVFLLGEMGLAMNVGKCDRIN